MSRTRLVTVTAAVMDVMQIGSPPNHANRHEVIADSEEEIEYAKSLSATSTKQPLHTDAVSSISDFTTIAYGARSDEIVSHSIADRTKTRQRTHGTKKRPVIHCDNDVIELTSEDDVVEKVTRSNAQPIKLKTKTKAKEKMTDNPLPSVPAIDSVQPRPRVRPRPRPIVKQARLNLDPLPPQQYPFACYSRVYDMPAIQPPPVATPPYHRQPDLPIATSPASANNTGMASQLPPSDPPNSTNTAGIGGTLPPIEILQDGESERDGDSYLLSPSSLFSDGGPGSKAKKRKRGVALTILENEHEVDQLMPSSPQRLEPTPHVGLAALDAYTHEPGPPPTFFAGSSSSTGRHVGERDSNASPNPQAEIIDLTDLPPTICYSNTDKSNKSKKLKVDTEINPTEDVRRDEGDSDFKPSGRKTAKKRKGKGKEKAPVQEKEDKPKEKKGRTRKKKEQMDGVVLLAGNRTGKTKAKQIEKEVFKSREIIDNSEDENDPLLLVERMQVDGKPLPSTTDGMPLPKVTDLNAGGLPSASGKSSSSRADEPNSSAAGSKAKAKLKGKKRKSIVESEQEGSEKENEIQVCIVVKKRKSDSDAPVSDEVEQERLDEKENAQKSARSGKDKPEEGLDVSRDDEVGDRESTTSDARQVRTRDCQRTNAQKAGKENFSGFSPSSAGRPLIGRVPSINPDVSTPLYARYEVAPRRSSLPMSELIRRASFKPGSPFPASFTPSHRDRGKRKQPELDVEATRSASTQSVTAAYSPYLKMSRRALSKIAPLHLNRKTPPLPAPPPPLKKKTKKELEREERWEEELVESVGGLEVWASMEDSERKQMRRAKMDMEMGTYDD